VEIGQKAVLLGDRKHWGLKAGEIITCTSSEQSYTDSLKYHTFRTSDGEKNFTSEAYLTIGDRVKLNEDGRLGTIRDIDERMIHIDLDYGGWCGCGVSIAAKMLTKILDEPEEVKEEPQAEQWVPEVGDKVRVKSHRDGIIYNSKVGDVGIIDDIDCTERCIYFKSSGGGRYSWLFPEDIEPVDDNPQIALNTIEREQLQNGTWFRWDGSSFVPTFSTPKISIKKEDAQMARGAKIREMEDKLRDKKEQREDLDREIIEDEAFLKMYKAAKSEKVLIDELKAKLIDLKTPAAERVKVHRILKERLGEHMELR
jgi:hypothetical protein